MGKQAARFTSTFSDVSKIILPSSCLNKAYKQMRVAALQHLEALALFAGIKEHNTFHILETFIPGQVNPKPEDTLSPLVPAGEMHRIRCWLEEKDFQLIAQIHSQHRTAPQVLQHAALPLLQLIGGISIVIPDFAHLPIKPESWVVYRLSAANKWIALDKQEICHLFEISY